MTDDGRKTVTVERYFYVPAERVFDAWIEPGTAGKWLFATPTGTMVRSETDPRVGGSFVFTDRRNGEDIDHVGVYLEIDRPRRLVFQFSAPKYSSLQTTVSIDIEPAQFGCRLRLTHEGVLPDYFERTTLGWSKLLSGLASKVDPNGKLGVITEPGTIRFERVLPGPIERVWAYLTESELRAKWFAAGDTEPREGGRIELHFNFRSLSNDAGKPPEKYAELGSKPGPDYVQRVTRYEPPRVLSWTWDGGMDGPSEVTYELSPHGGKVLLVLTHRRIAGRHIADIGEGWHAHLRVLVERLSDREPAAFWNFMSEIEGVYEGLARVTEGA